MRKIRLFYGNVKPPRRLARFPNMRYTPTMDYANIPQDGLYHYTVHRAGEKIRVDGNLEKPVWQKAAKSAGFVDMVSGAPAFFDTRMAALWDADALYIAFQLAAPVIKASQTERDSLVWFDSDVEIFLDGEDCYYELEVNALNTVYEVFFVYQDAYKKGCRFDTAEFDLTKRNVDVLCGFQDGSRYKKHKHGKRWAFMDWDFPELETAVKVNGTINDAKNVSEGWTVEMALPWAGFKTLSPSKKFPPSAGDSIRAQFFRFEALEYNGKRHAESPGWALNAHGVYDSHIPERFAFLDFAD